MQSLFTPQPLRLWGIVITEVVLQAVRNSARTKKLTDEFCIFFGHDLCPWAINPINLFMAPSHQLPFSKMSA